MYKTWTAWDKTSVQTEALSFSTHMTLRKKVDILSKKSHFECKNKSFCLKLHWENRSCHFEWNYTTFWLLFVFILGSCHLRSLDYYRFFFSLVKTRFKNICDKKVIFVLHTILPIPCGQKILLLKVWVAFEILK